MCSFGKILSRQSGVRLWSESHSSPISRNCTCDSALPGSTYARLVTTSACASHHTTLQSRMRDSCTVYISEDAHGGVGG